MCVKALIQALDVRRTRFGQRIGGDDLRLFQDVFGNHASGLFTSQGPATQDVVPVLCFRHHDELVMIIAIDWGELISADADPNALHGNALQMLEINRASLVGDF